MSAKKVIWSSWNAIADEYLDILQADLENMENLLSDQGMGESPMFLFDKPQMGMIHTPLGAYPLDSMLKPSNRWDCRIGTTNFSITKSIESILKKEIEGIEALRILGRYTFFIGIPVTFDFSDVRKEIEDKLCIYTESEVLNNEETKITVDLVKEQIKDEKYWSILVTPSGKVDYIVSSDMDKKYLDGLSDLFELKRLLGGIILRGEHG